MTSYSALPDPHYDRAFYDGVPLKRFIAWVVDVIMIVLISLILSVLTFTVALWFWSITYLIVAFLYRSITIGTWSATPGMRLMALELRREDGKVFNRTDAMMHTGLYLFLSISILLQLGSVGLIAYSQRHQGLHDMVLRSVMLNRPQ